MVSVVAYGDVESAAKAWLATTDVAPLVTRTAGGLSVFLAMPASAPTPCVIVRRVGGGPAVRKDLPEDHSRLSFDCWADTRSQAILIARTLIAECDSLGRNGGYIAGSVYLCVADVLSLLWLPDPDSDKPRYIVDALVTSLTA